MEISREDIGLRMSQRLRSLSLENPLVLAIPGAGIIFGNIIAQEIDAELDVILFEKIHEDVNSGAIMGVLGEGGEIVLFGGNRDGLSRVKVKSQELERDQQELEEAKRFYRFLKKQARIEGRSVIVVDEGIRTGETMRAVFSLIRLRNPKHLIVAVPVSTAESAQRMRTQCDSLICLEVLEKDHLWSASPELQKEC